MPTNVVDALSRVDMLSSLDKKHLEKLAKDFSERSFPAGTVVVSEGSEHGIGFFVVADGEAVASVGGEEVARLGPGSHFGEVALISDRIRTASVTAVTDLHTYVMTVWDFRSFVQSDAEVAWKLLEQLAEMLHRQPAHTHSH
ncbi:MAG TPA: cyclic nucleotide-binding domain-containing protein [Candidatus Limnocylindrales bacterium]|nr:cyclic nucleotide-binding domain-containing protein [Candidatus Limnocylindrales bacterium]